MAALQDCQYERAIQTSRGNKLLLNDRQLGWYTLLCGELLLGPLEISLTKNCTFSAALPFETIQCQLDSIE